jgi:uncharacterized protein
LAAGSRQASRSKSPLSQGLPPDLSGLMSPAAYPHPAGDVQLIQTHISWVLLAGDYAYKIARPVRFVFIDLGTAAQRADLIEEGRRLNRRFAPEVYVGVCDVVRREGMARIGSARRRDVRGRR